MATERRGADRPPDPWALALRLLTRRSYSAAELAERLRSRGCPAEASAAALQRCRDLGYLDDERYAHQRAAALQRNGRAVGRRLLYDLRQHGVTAELAAVAQAAAAEEHPPAALLAEQLQRRYPDFHYATADERQRRRVVNFFLRRGFELALVLSILQQERPEQP